MFFIGHRGGRKSLWLQAPPRAGGHSKWQSWGGAQQRLPRTAPHLSPALHGSWDTEISLVFAPLTVCSELGVRLPQKSFLPTISEL